MYIETCNALRLCRLDMQGLNPRTASVRDSAECPALAGGVMSE
jgi:hypothetical protein